MCEIKAKVCLQEEELCLDWRFDQFVTAMSTQLLRKLTGSYSDWNGRILVKHFFLYEYFYFISI